MKSNQIYAFGETIYIQTHLYILGGRGFAVKLKQSGERLMVQVNESTIMSIEKYLKMYQPSGYERWLLIKHDPEATHTAKEGMNRNKSQANHTLSG